MADDVVLDKAAIIERRIARVREEYAGDPRNLTDNITRQDSIILNLQRACEAAIDLAMHVVRCRRLGIPQETRDAFRLLQESGVLSPPLADRLMRMVDPAPPAGGPGQTVMSGSVARMTALDSNCSCQVRRRLH